MIRRLSSWCLGLALLACASISSAATLTVTSAADSGAGSLRDALANVQDGDTVDFAFTSPTTIVLQSYLTIAKAISVQGPVSGSGLAAVNLVTLSGNNQVRVLYVSPPTITSPITLRNLNVTQGKGQFGGGIICDRGRLILINSAVSGNTADFGAGIYYAANVLTLINSTVSGNTATVRGGGIYGGNAALIAVNSTFAGNGAGDTGGGIHNSGGSVTLTNSTVSGNHSGSYGGGVNSANGVHAVNSIIAGNTQSGSGDINPGLDASSGGNVVSYIDNVVDPKLAPLGSYGGPTQTMIALPGSSAICQGDAAVALDVDGNALTLDQRGAARTTSYAGAPCVDAGAVQVSYGLSFDAPGTQPPTSVVVGAAMAPAPAVALLENGVAFNTTTYPSLTGLALVPIVISDSASALSAGSAQSVVPDLASGLATYTDLSFDSVQASDSLSATWSLRSADSEASPPASARVVSVTSRAFAVAAATTTTALAASPPSTVYGQSTILTATVSLAPASTAAIAGTVAFITSGTALPGCSAVPVSSGMAQCQIASLAPGTHPIIATYTPTNANTASSASSATNVMVDKASTATAITPPGAIMLGDPVSITAGVMVVAPGAGVATGTITIDDGGATAGDSCTITLPATSCALTPSSAGTKTLSATFIPDANASANFNGSAAAPVTLTVNPAQAGSALSSSANPSVFGQAVTLVGTVTAVAGGVTPTTGNGVHFLIDDVAVCAGVVLVPTGMANAASASCTMPQSSMGAGSHTVKFVYAGDANNQASNATLSQTVNAAPTTTTITPPSGIRLGESLNVTVSVGAQPPGAGTPAGTVTVEDGGENCTAVLSNGTGVCTLTPPAPAGSHRISATYTATSEFASSTGTANLTVDAAPAGTVVTSSINPSTFGQSVTFTATVSASAGNPTPTGKLDFHDGGGVIAGCAGVSLNAGVATCMTSNLSVGSHTIQASYLGDANSQASSGTLTQTVNAASTNMTLSATPNPALVGQAVALSATVTNAIAATSIGAQFIATGSPVPAGASSAMPTGTVTFFDGTTNLGSSGLNASGVATLDLNSLAVGTHNLSATYAGDGSSAQASAQITLVVNAAPVPPVPAPTLSWWMLIALGMALACAGSLLGRARHFG